MIRDDARGLPTISLAADAAPDVKDFVHTSLTDAVILVARLTNQRVARAGSE